MAKHKKNSDLGIVEPAKGMVVGGSVLGLGGSVVAGVGGSTAASAGAGLTAAASFMPAMGVAIGAGVAVKQLKKVQKQVKKRR